MEKKTCRSCNIEIPKNDTYFFKRNTKQVNSKGEIKIYNSFRSDCKKCCGKKNEKRRVKKRCDELGCDVDNYKKNWKKQYKKTVAKDLVAMEILTKSQYQNYLVLLKSGYVTDYKSYLKRIEKNKEKRNYRVLNSVMDRMKYFTIEDRKKAIKKYAKNEMLRVTDSYVANVVMKTPVKELSPQIIETKRLIIKLKRELNK